MRITTRMIARSGLVAAALTLVVASFAVTRPASLSAAAVASPSGEFQDRWLQSLDGKHRQFFDSPAPNGGIVLVHMMNYYDTWNRAYDVPDRELDAVGTFYGNTTFYGLDDAAWAKYRLGEFLEATDPATGKPALRNPWRSSPVVLGMTLPGAGVEALQKRGATFILCNNALTIFAGVLAQQRGLDAEAVYADLKQHILPGVELIPGMVVAIDQAHAAGLSYHRQ